MYAMSIKPATRKRNKNNYVKTKQMDWITSIAEGNKL